MVHVCCDVCVCVCVVDNSGRGPGGCDLHGGLHQPHPGLHQREPHHGRPRPRPLLPAPSKQQHTQPTHPPHTIHLHISRVKKARLTVLGNSR